jgi:flavodoxin
MRSLTSFLVALFLAGSTFVAAAPTEVKEMNGKTLVVYYSYTGNTELVAKTLALGLGADLRKIEDVKTHGKFYAYLIGGRDAMKDRPWEIKPFDYDFNAYDTIFIGSPIWAWATTPQINEFLSKADLKNKKVIAFVTMGGSYGKAVDKMKEKITAKGGTLIDSFAIKTAGVKQEVIAAKTNEFITKYRAR